MEWIWFIVSFINEMSFDVDQIGVVTEGFSYFGYFLVDLGNQTLRKLTFQNEEQHCKGCLCKNPILLQMLKERMISKNYKLEEIPDYFNKTEENPEILTIYSGDTNKKMNEYECEDFGETYSTDFLQRCRDPQFLQNELNKIEEGYQSKISQLQERRHEELLKHETRYNKIKNEILNDDWYQI